MFRKKISLGGIMLLSVFIVMGTGLPASAGRPPQNGTQRVFFNNGTLRMESVYKKGRIVRLRYFYHNGRVLSEQRYKNDKLILEKAFYENGKLKSIWTLKSGQTRFYHKDGKIKAVMGRGKAG